ncbi:alpha-amylase family glycosyl hydrolase [Paenibacillus sp. YPG26]|uniref:alpha-amylase family glycosyl hydrolase n=1 Tax=Paenibacillus sp. YPG26 TaxID=2878915 RepID=UPI00203A91FF|nr:alpha-amylase family glycosyl hydrolase [Paenibacillus sp. YPG26]USB34011.1 alpha-glucosidase C-terminal domain-containing protein [Paenibacillus sp. YPG26]
MNKGTASKSVYKLPRWLAVAALLTGLLSGCSSSSAPDSGTAPSKTANEAPAAGPKTENQKSAASTLQQGSTVYYEIFVRSYADSNGDGIGDLNGITAKLDYLKDLGVGGLWLTPINPSPSYHGYDVTDHRAINPDFGTLADFDKLIQEAHQRDIKVIMDLVVNHTSKQHPWFVQSAKEKKSKFRDWYTWAEDQNKNPEGPSAASSGGAWHPLLGSHYLAAFSDSMPDLNFDNPEVRSEIEDIGRFWLSKGVDGFRLDAAKHIYEDLQSDRNEATTAKNVAWWQEFRSRMSEANPSVYLVGEVWEDSASSVAVYLDRAFDSGFNFGLAKLILNAATGEKDNNFAFTLKRTYDFYAQKSNGKFTDAVFLSNHDQNRVMSVLGGDTNHAKMAASILLTLPGNPFLYYGEEIGMKGSKPDEEIREPMQWYAAGKGAGQTTWEPAANNSGKDAPSVEGQLKDPDSLLNHYKELISWKKQIPALQGGNIDEYTQDNTSMMAYVRTSGKETVLVVHNLSGREQMTTLTGSPGVPAFKNILKTTNSASKLDGAKLHLPPYTTVIVTP